MRNSITLEHVIQAVKDLKAGVERHGEVARYEQRSFCGTSCCVFGHANALAGNKLFIANTQALEELEKGYWHGTELRRSLVSLMLNGRAPLQFFVDLLEKHGIKV